MCSFLASYYVFIQLALSLENVEIQTYLGPGGEQPRGCYSYLAQLLRGRPTILEIDIEECQYFIHINSLLVVGKGEHGKEDNFEWSAFHL